MTLALLAPSPALAETASTSLAQGLGQAAVVVALFIGALGLCALGAKRLFANGLRARAERRSLAVVDILPLGPKQRACVLRCYDRTFLLGLGEREVCSIAELDAVVGEGKAELVTAPEERELFLKALSQEQRDALLARARKEVAKRERAKRAELLEEIQASETRDRVLVPRRDPRGEPAPQARTKRSATKRPKAAPEPIEPAERERTRRALDALTVRRITPPAVESDGVDKVDTNTRPRSLGGLLA